jgi:hypothetical protein
VRPQCCLYSADCVAQATEPLLPLDRLATGIRAHTDPNVVDDDIPGVINDQVDWADFSGQDDTRGGLWVERNPNRASEIVASAHWNEAENRLPEFVATIQCRNDAVEAAVPASHYQLSAPHMAKEVVELISAGSNADLDRRRCPKCGNGDVEFLVICTACLKVCQQEYRVHYCDTTKQRRSACPEEAEGCDSRAGQPSAGEGNDLASAARDRNPLPVDAAEVMLDEVVVSALAVDLKK